MKATKMYYVTKYVNHQQKRCTRKQQQQSSSKRKVGIIILTFLFVLVVESKAPPKEAYLYNDGQESYPVVEHITKSKLDRLAKPNFILDVSWPRIIQFYIPTSSKCIYFKSNYIKVAKEFRRRSKYAPVGFYSVSCYVHKELCNDYSITKENSKTTLPKIIGIPAGTTEGMTLEITNDNRLDINYVSNELGIVLIAAGSNKQEDQEQEGITSDNNNIMEQGKKKDDNDKRTQILNNLRANSAGNNKHVPTDEGLTTTTTDEESNVASIGNNQNQDLSTEGNVRDETKGVVAAAMVDTSTTNDGQKHDPTDMVHHHRHNKDYNNDNFIDPNEMNDFGGNIHHSHQQQMDYADAYLSLVYTLEHYVHLEEEEKQDTQGNEDGNTSSNNSGVEPDRALALMEFIDLLHWSLPSYWNIHNLINDIRNDIGSCLTSQLDLLTIIKRHPPPHPLKVGNTFHRISGWSESCTNSNNSNDNINDENNNSNNLMESYLCGIWKLLHIISIGVHEQHLRVLGDTERVQMSHVAKTSIRQFVKYFLSKPCEECYDRFDIYFKSNCIDNEQQQNQQQQLQLPSSCIDQYPSLSSSSTNLSKPNWKELSLWLWAVHNQVNTDIELESKQSLGITTSTTSDNIMRMWWPSTNDCISCWTSNNNKYNSHEIYQHIKQTYWPQGVSNARFVVLDKAHYEDKLTLQLTLWERWIGIDSYTSENDEDDSEEEGNNKSQQQRGEKQHGHMHSQHNHHYHYSNVHLLHKIVKLALFGIFGLFAITYMTNIARSSTQLKSMYDLHKKKSTNKKKKNDDDDVNDDDDYLFLGSNSGNLFHEDNHTTTMNRKTNNERSNSRTMTILNHYFEHNDHCNNNQNEPSFDSTSHTYYNGTSISSSYNGVNHRRGF